MINRFIAMGVMLVLIPQLAFSKNQKTRKPSQSKEQSIFIKSVYGEKISLFSITPSNETAVVEFSNNSGTKSSRTISAKDFDFIKGKVSKISGASNDKAFCLRNYTAITTGNREIIGCMGAPNRVAKDIQETVNLLSILF